MKIAAVDLGTNSFLCLIAEVKGSGDSKTLDVIEDKARVVRVGEKVHQNRFFLPEALKRAASCLDEFQKIIQKHKVDVVIGTATSAARDATNGHELIQLGSNRGIPIHIIEGAREAELSFEGALTGIKNAGQKKILVIDVGGGSTEFIYREPNKPLHCHSFDVGCVRLTEIYLKSDPVKKEEYDEMMQHALSLIKSFGVIDPDLVVAVAGTPTTLACVDQKIDFNDHLVEGHKLTRERIQTMAKSLGALPLSERKNLKGLEPLRADVIIAGCALLDCGLELAKKNELQVSTRGLRYGVALHYDEFEK